jgi:hypothetical protein
LSVATGAVRRSIAMILERAKGIEPSTLSLGSGSEPERVELGWTPLDK